LNRLAILLAIIVVTGVVGFLILKHRYSGGPPVRLASSRCDVSLWQHVYERERLQVIEECTAVEGRVVKLHEAEDGDLHIALDPDDKSVLNLLNAVHAKGTLVVEVVCRHSATGSTEQAACRDYQSTVLIPRAGDRVRVTGAYVTDRDNGWREIHPVSQIEVLH